MRSGVAKNSKVARELAGGRATLGLVQPITAAVLAGAILAGPLAQNGFDAPLDSGVRVQSLAGRSSCALWTAAEQLARLARVPLRLSRQSIVHRRDGRAALTPCRGRWRVSRCASL